MPSITISIPAFNEAGTLTQVVDQSVAVLQKVSHDYEVVVIDDGSNDETPNLLNSLRDRHACLRVYRHASNEGIGPTLQDVFGKPTKDYVFFIPGDGQIPPEELEQLFPHLETADFILGYRSNRQDPFLRCFYARLYNIFISFLMRKRIRDVDSVILVRRQAYESSFFLVDIPVMAIMPLVSARSTFFALRPTAP